VIEEVPAEDTDWVETYYRMSVELYRRQHLPPAIPRALFENVSRVLGASGKVRVVFAKYQDQVVAGQIFLIHGNHLYFWDAASKQEYNYLRANNLIQWHIIRWACSHGLRVYDMMGANIPRIAQFKKGYGGSFVPYSTFVYTRGFLARVGELGYKWLAPTARRMIALLPRGQ
jgi:predicted N-acyltransferase